MAFKDTCRCLVMMSPIDTRNLIIIIFKTISSQDSRPISLISYIIFVLKVHLIKFS